MLVPSPLPRISHPNPPVARPGPRHALRATARALRPLRHHPWRAAAAAVRRVRPPARLRRRWPAARGPLHAAAAPLGRPRPGPARLGPGPARPARPPRRPGRGGRRRLPYRAARPGRFPRQIRPLQQNRRLLPARNQRPGGGLELATVRNARTLRPDRLLPLQLKPHLQLRAQGVDDLGSAVDGDAVIFVALIARDLRGINVQPLGQLGLAHVGGDSQANQRVPQAAQRSQLAPSSPRLSCS